MISLPDTNITEIHPDIIRSHILTKLDGTTLTTTSSTCSELFSLCSDDVLWRDICTSTWPSTADPRVIAAITTFPSGHKSFFSDVFPAARHLIPKSEIRNPIVESDTSEYISAVDIYYEEKVIYSKVFVTETLSCWFLTSPFQLDLLAHRETVPTPIKYDIEDGSYVSLAEHKLKLSWILIDPVMKRAVNFASRVPVQVRRHWLTEDLHLRYATVVAAGGGQMAQCGVFVTCEGKDGGELMIREVSLQVEDMEGRIETGMDSLVILNDAMEGQRRKSDGKFEKDIYEQFVKSKVENIERKERREKSVDVVCLAAGVSVFIASWLFFMST